MKQGVGLKEEKGHYGHVLQKDALEDGGLDSERLALVDNAGKKWQEFDILQWQEECA